MVENPDGSGNPDAVTCRKPKPLPGIVLRHGPEVCQTNQFWVSLVKDRQVVDAMGVVIGDSWFTPTNSDLTGP